MHILFKAAWENVSTVQTCTFVKFIACLIPEGLERASGQILAENHLNSTFSGRMTSCRHRTTLQQLHSSFQNQRESKALPSLGSWVGPSQVTLRLVLLRSAEVITRLPICLW